MKIKALSAVLYKRFGVEAARELTPSHRTLGDVYSPEALEHYQALKREHKEEDARAARRLRDRPGVIVYVTRAAPFEWELLLFDVIGEPGYQSIVPEAGSSRARRRKMPGCGRCSRKLVSRCGSFESSASTTGRISSRRCPSSPPMTSGFSATTRCGATGRRSTATSRSGGRGDLLPTLKRQRVVAYITRDSAQGRELLVFEIPAEPGSVF